MQSLEVSKPGAAMMTDSRRRSVDHRFNGKTHQCHLFSKSSQSSVLAPNSAGNALHPFREGNGRAQREFIRDLAVESNYEISWDLVTQDEMFAASVASFHGGSNEGFARILNKIIRPVR
jgi:hypothetical protein